MQCKPPRYAQSSKLARRLNIVHLVIQCNLPVAGTPTIPVSPYSASALTIAARTHTKDDQTTAMTVTVEVISFAIDE